MTEKILQQTLDVMKSVDKTLKSLSSTLSAQPSSQKAQKAQSSQTVAPTTAKASKSQKAYDSQLAFAAQSFAGLIQRQKKLADLTEKVANMTDKELRTSVEGQKIREEYNKALAESAADLEQNTALNLKTREVQKLVNMQMHEQQAAIRRNIMGNKDLTSNMSKVQRGASLLGASLLESNVNFREGSTEYSAWIDELTESSKGLNALGDSFLRSAGIIDNVTGDIRDNISAKDFAGLRLKLGEAQEAISESFAGLEAIGVSGMQDAINRISELSKLSTVAGEGAIDPEQVKQLQLLKERLRDTAEQLAKSNISMGKFAHMFDENGKMTEDAFDNLQSSAEDLGVHINSVNSTLSAAAAKQDALGKAAHTATGKMSMFVAALSKDPGGFMLEKLQGKFGTIASIMSGVSQFASGAKQVWKEASEFNVAQVPSSFMDVQKASIKMGMSFEATTKFMQENKRMLAMYGSEGFDTLIGQSKDTFAKFGYNMQQASELVGPAIEAGISSGINVRSGDALNKFIDQSMDSFKNISGIVNISAKEYMALNAELLNSQEIAGTMVGMDQQRAQAYAQDIISLRNEYTQRGLSVQQANELLKIQQQQQREKISTKFMGAAKGMALAQSLGLSSQESSRYQQLSLKGNRSKEESNELQEISSKMGKAMEEQRVNAYDQSTGAGMAKDIMYENLLPEGAARQMIDKGVQFAQAERAGTVTTPEVARKAGEKATGSEAMADMGNVVNNVSSLMSNGFTTALVGATMALGGLALQAKGGIGGLLGNIGGKGVGGIAGEAVGSVGGKASGILGKVGNIGKGLLGSAGSLVKGLLTGPGAATGLIGTGVDYAGDKIKEAGHKKTGSVVSALGTTAQYMGAGAAIGNIIPGVGTAIGAGLGGLYGAYKGITENSEGLSEILSSVTGMFGSNDEKKPLTPAEDKKTEPKITATVPPEQPKEQKVEAIVNQPTDIPKDTVANDRLTTALTKVTPALVGAAKISPQESASITSSTTADTLKSVMQGLPFFGTASLGASLGTSLAGLFSSKEKPATTVNKVEENKPIAQKPSSAFDLSKLPVIGTSFMGASLGASLADLFSTKEKPVTPNGAAKTPATPAVEKPAANTDAQAIIASVKKITPDDDKIATLSNSVQQLVLGGQPAKADLKKKPATPEDFEPAPLEIDKANLADTSKYLTDAIMGDTSNNIVEPTDNIAIPSPMKMNSIAQPGQQIQNPDINSKSEKTSDSEEKSDEIAKVSDETSQQHLVTIADSLAAAVALLAKIAESNENSATPQLEKRPLISQNIPTSYGYITGRT